MGGAWANGAWSGDSASGSVTARSSVGCDAPSTIVASSAGAYFRRALKDGATIELAGQPIATAADAKSSPPTLWSVANTGNMSSASVTSGRLQMTIGTGFTADFFGGTATAPYFTRSDSPRSFDGNMEIIGRIDASALQSNHAVRFALSGLAASSGRATVYVDLYQNAGVYQFRYGYDGSPTTVSINSTKAAAGVWFRLSISPAGVTVSYDTDTGGTDSTVVTWTQGATSTTPLTATGGLYAAGAAWSQVFAIAPGTSSGVSTTGGLILARQIASPSLPGATFAALNGSGFPSTSDALTLIANADFETATTIDLTMLRLVLAAAVNRYPNATATATFSLTGSASPSPAESTYQSAAAVTVKDPATGNDTTSSLRYYALRMKFASSGGTQGGTILTAMVDLRSS